MKTLSCLSIMTVLVFLVSGCSQDEVGSGYGGPISAVGPGKAPFHQLPPSVALQKIDDIAKLPFEIPPPIDRNYSETVSISLKSTEVISEIAPGVTFEYWTFNNTVPGPFLRVREGDTVELTLENDASSEHVHSIDLHAVTGPGGGATLSQVAPGDSKTFRFKALNPGLYVYHCATPNVPQHMANGMYGLILVEPTSGLPEVDREFYVMQGELYTEGRVGEAGFQTFSPEKMLYERPEYVIFNGRVRSLVDHSLKAEVGESVRLFVGNGGVSFISSFHVIGEIFDRVYEEAASGFIENVQTTAIPAGGAAIIDFEIEVPGNFILVDHSLARLDKGAYGFLTASGDENLDIYGEVR